MITIGILGGARPSIVWFILKAFAFWAAAMAPGAILVLLGKRLQARHAPAVRKQHILQAWQAWAGKSNPVQANDVETFHRWLLEQQPQWLGSGAERFGMPELREWLRPGKAAADETTSAT